MLFMGDDIKKSALNHQSVMYMNGMEYGRKEGKLIVKKLMQ
jgi:hypothetical protein